MAAGNAEITSIMTGEPWNAETDQQPGNFQTGLSNTEPVTDEVGTKRAKLLKRMCIISLVVVLISAGSIIVGVMAWLTSDSKFPYVMSGGAIAGGMTFLYVGCASCVYFEGKKTKTGTKMTRLYTCCLRSLTMWFAFLICGLSITFGISGIWGTVECYRALKKLYLSMNHCLEHTDEKFVLSILTMIISAVLFVLSLAILCLYTCNTRVFGLRSLSERQDDYYTEIIRGAQEQAVREYQMNAQNNSQDRQVLGYVEPSAPPLVDIDRSHGQRREDDRAPRGRAHDSYDYRPGPRPQDHEQDRSRNPRRPGPRGRPERGKRERVRKNEEPPPRYEEVVKDYIKPDDV